MIHRSAPCHSNTGWTWDCKFWLLNVLLCTMRGVCSAIKLDPLTGQPRASKHPLFNLSILEGQLNENPSTLPGSSILSWMKTLTLVHLSCCKSKMPSANLTDGRAVKVYSDSIALSLDVLITYKDSCVDYHLQHGTYLHGGWKAPWAPVSLWNNGIGLDNSNVFCFFFFLKTGS